MIKKEKLTPPWPPYDHDDTRVTLIYAVVNATAEPYIYIYRYEYRRVTTLFWKTIIIVRAINSFLWHSWRRPARLVLLLYFSFRILYINAQKKVRNIPQRICFHILVAGCLIESCHLCGVQCAVYASKACCSIVRKSVRAFGGNVNLLRVFVDIRCCYCC